MSGVAASAHRALHCPTAPTASLGFEAQVWAVANALRVSMDAAEYGHVVLTLLFLDHISGAFGAHHARLETEHGHLLTVTTPGQGRVSAGRPGDRGIGRDARGAAPAFGHALGFGTDQLGR